MTGQSRRLDWNTGAWFGSQLGATVWILVSAAISLGHDISTGLILLLLFLVPNTAGLILWRRRRLSCYVSIQILFTLCGLAGLLAVYVLDRNDLWLEIQKGGAISSGAGYFLLCSVVLGVMIFFHLKFGQEPDEPPT